MKNISHFSRFTIHLDLVLVVGLEFFAGFSCFIIGFVVTAILGLRLVVAVGAVVLFLVVFAHIDDHLSVKECLQVLREIYIFSEEKIYV